MSLNISGILIDSLPNLECNFQSQDYEIKKISELSPKNLSITFINNATLILMDNIFFKNVNEESELTDLEKDISKLFPKSNIWIFVLNDTIDFMGFCRLQNEIKLRSKFVGQGRPFLDFGELHPIEQKLYNDYSEILFEDKKIKQIFDEKFESIESSEVKKQFLIFRDNILANRNIENNFPYLSGKMEFFYIDYIIEKILNKKIIELLEIEFVSFNKFNFKFNKESLKDYLLTAINSNNQRNIR